jgi:16S rRNA (cytidine1402-2'-O)-methyltransferase
MTANREGCLYVVSTPIGNLEDITLRALRVLKEADTILAEDTRRTRILCTHHAIRTPLRSFHAHTSNAVLDALLRQLVEGAHLALVSDAGTPLISDPGANLVRGAIDAEVQVEAIPGATAVAAALCVSGVAGDSFSFVGFVPRTGPRRKAFLHRLQSDESIQVFFESPHRLHATLQQLADVLSPDRSIAVCREMTKLHQQVLRGSVREVLENLPSPVRGEITVVVQGASPAESQGTHPEQAHSLAMVDRAIQEHLAQGHTPRDIVRMLDGVFALPKKELYRRVLHFVE